jgi:hypothetical protein
MNIPPDLPNASIGEEAGTVVQSERAAGSQSWISVCAMAAGLVLGVLLAASFGLGADMRSAGGALLAQGELASTLSNALVSDDGDRRGGARIGASFWSKNGSFCRTFIARRAGETALAGIACRERGSWRIPVLATADSGEAGDNSVTEGLPAPVRSVMANLMVGAPLDQDAERQARNQAWRPR